MLPNTLPQKKSKFKPQHKQPQEVCHIRKQSSKHCEVLNSLDFKPKMIHKNDPSLNPSIKIPVKNENKQNVSLIPDSKAKVHRNAKLTTKYITGSAFCQSIDLAEEIEAIVENIESDIETYDGIHNTPPVFVTSKQNTQPSSPTSNKQNTKNDVSISSKQSVPTVLRNMPMFKHNISPRGEDVEDLTGCEVESLNDDLSKKDEKLSKHIAGSTTDNSSGCTSDVFIDSIPFSDKEQVGPQSFVAHRLLGKGSFGEVYLVQKIGTTQLYAMKIVKKAKILSQNLIKYSLTERRVLSEVRHPFIVRLHFAFQATSRLFLVLDYCPGGDLSDYLRRERKFTEERAKMYIMEILLALEYLHKKDIIFRDLKPDNVVLDEDGHALLTDFGLSKEGVYDNQGAKSFCGSLAYLAPEMIKRTGHGKSVDWYLLGVLLYEMLVGVPPYYSSDKYSFYIVIEIN